MVQTDTKPIPVQPAPRRRRRRGWVVALVVVLVLLALAVVGLVVADGVARAEAERQIAAQVSGNLPPEIGGGLSAEVHGFSALQQLAGGAFDEVELEGEGLTIAGQPADARITLRGLPVSGQGTVREAIGSLTISQAVLDALDPLADQQATPPRLGRNTVSTTIEREFAFVPVTIDLTLEPRIDGTDVRLSPVDAELTSGPVSVPATEIARTLLPDGIAVCTARYLPPNVELTALDVRPGEARLGFIGRDVDLADLQAGRTGNC